MQLVRMVLDEDFDTSEMLEKCEFNLKKHWEQNSGHCDQFWILGS